MAPMTTSAIAVVAALACCSLLSGTTAFTPYHSSIGLQQQQQNRLSRQQQPSRPLSFVLHAKTSRLDASERPKKSGRKPSKVVDHDGPTEQVESAPVNEVDPEDVPELVDIQSADDLPHPIPHQPWRRGETAGCEAPITAEWRLEADDLMKKAAMLVGASVLDVTWYLTQVVVTLDEEMIPEPDIFKSTGPVIDICDPVGPMYKDPTDPDPEPIWDDQDEVMYQRETEEEMQASADSRYRKYAAKDEEDPEDEPHIADQLADDDVKLYMNEETREEVALRVAEEEALRDEESEKPIDMASIRIDTGALSAIAEAILQALETREEELQILARHELILTSPGAVDVLETQRQFDAFRGSNIIVETQDPFDSNRTLKGKLVDRNSMDLIINKKGRMVTIPHNFVKCVRLPATKDEEAVAA